MLRKTFICIASLLVVIALTGYNTEQGIGKDFESAGRSIERSSGK